jgi:hypothetical protein
MDNQPGLRACSSSYAFLVRVTTVRELAADEELNVEDWFRVSTLVPARVGIRAGRTCFGLAMTTFSTCGAITAAADIALPAASISTLSSGDSLAANGSSRPRRMSTRRRSVPLEHGS